MEIAPGTVVTELRPSHTSAEFINFLTKINHKVFHFHVAPTTAINE